ncbi:hypothetical protein [Halomonas nitroreducens]|uniref:Peroxiredoxin n=1 Tax=Halomonas nitroreducens TaxID=447425 RepID=A0A3S0HSW6_9GAMM|nr:hypothetical protein [Halomonas nitroreducens]RTR07168.1 hypothetical protein EKG36_01585 [Halomonas nitroreducens]
MQWRNLILAAAVMVASPVLAAEHEGDHDMSDKALVILSSDSLQTQGMAMVLSRTMQQQGSDLSVLLCDQAGDLAVASYQSPEALKTAPGSPMASMKPEMLLQALIDDGAQVDVCALYLPNSDYAEEDLRQGVGVATPPPMAEMMRDPSIPVFTF